MEQIKRTITVVWDGAEWRDQMTGVLVTGLRPPWDGESTATQATKANDSGLLQPEMRDAICHMLDHFYSAEAQALMRTVAEVTIREWVRRWYR